MVQDLSEPDPELSGFNIGCDRQPAVEPESLAQVVRSFDRRRGPLAVCRGPHRIVESSVRLACRLEVVGKRGGVSVGDVRRLF